MTVGKPPFHVHISNLENADGAALVDTDVPDVPARLTSIFDGSTSDTAMSISFDKTKGMHIHKKVPVTEPHEEEVITMNFKHKCPKCSRSFPTLNGMKVQMTRFSDKPRRPRSHKGTLA